MRTNPFIDEVETQRERTLHGDEMNKNMGDKTGGMTSGMMTWNDDNVGSLSDIAGSPVVITVGGLHCTRKLSELCPRNLSRPLISSQQAKVNDLVEVPLIVTLALLVVLDLRHHGNIDVLMAPAM